MTRNSKNEMVDIACELIHETDMAYLIDSGEGEYWLPKSKCSYEGGVIEVPEWLAENKGLI